MAVVELEPAHANCLSSASAFSSQYVIPIPRYIVCDGGCSTPARAARAPVELAEAEVAWAMSAL